MRMLASRAGDTSHQDEWVEVLVTEAESAAARKAMLLTAVVVAGAAVLLRSSM